MFPFMRREMKMPRTAGVATRSWQYYGDLTLSFPEVALDSREKRFSRRILSLVGFLEGTSLNERIARHRN